MFAPTCQSIDYGSACLSGHGRLYGVVAVAANRH